MPDGDAHARNAARTDHPVLELGQLDKGRFDTVLDRPDLMGDVQSGLFDYLPAHDLSLPEALASGPLVLALSWTRGRAGQDWISRERLSSPASSIPTEKLDMIATTAITAILCPTPQTLCA
jgi:hypothetical protein